ncbi:MAG: aspartate carbamoyltransferase regulatory subunit [Defluviitaleaceae bacterium]|nr:aspartate carbamoyltransferase regulatory subunit [Defluviitaleaceae bacterium]
MEVKNIQNGIVIDHIHAGFGLKILEHLDIDKGLGSVALLMNVPSEKYGRKDLIKLENTQSVDINILGLIDHQATVIYIKDGVIAQKTTVDLPKKVTNVIKCKNPRCVTSVEPVPHIFHLVEGSGKYRCEYCDNAVKSFDE